MKVGKIRQPSEVIKTSFSSLEDYIVVVNFQLIKPKITKIIGLPLNNFKILFHPILVFSVKPICMWCCSKCSKIIALDENK